MTPYIGRFAPSPTGRLHFGSLVACLASYLDARAHQGTWLLRIEDVDTIRCKPEYAADSVQTLRSLGFTWDGEIVYQHQRSAYYAAALDKLQAQGHTYACRCSRREIADSTQHGIEGPIYPGTCRHLQLTMADHAIRIRSDSGHPGADADTRFIDRLQGLQVQNIADTVGDYVVRRRDGLYAYQLAVVVDDAAQGVTHVVRGRDLLESTARQIQLQQLLGYPTPTYHHIPLVLNPLGQKLSKQTLAPHIQPEAARTQLLSALNFLGQSTPRALQAGSLADLLHLAIQEWDPMCIPKSDKIMMV